MASNAPPNRRYGVSCIHCRRKKVRCDGEKPQCRRCLKSEFHCTYKDTSDSLAAARSDLHACRTRLQHLEEGIKRLALADDDERDPLIRALAATIQTDRDSVPRADFSDDAEHAGTAEEGQMAKPAEISVDEDGGLLFFGATSRFHDVGSKHAAEKTQHKIDVAFHTKWLASNARFHQSWQEVAFSKLEKDPDVDISISSTLLQIYWTWQAPLHNCVYRHCFFRDMALGGPYFTPFLLNCIFAHASRHVPDDDPIYVQVGQGEQFLNKAKTLLVAEFDQLRPRIPTIQGLLILGGRQCAVGRTSEGWLYTGMAIRMMRDLGLHLNGAKLDTSDLEPDDLEARKRLFLSAYCWDKSISLCLGRPPSLTELPYRPDSLLDYTGDTEPWKPFYLPDVAYPRIPSHKTLTFVHFCRLSMIVNDCYKTVYSGRLDDLKFETVLTLEKKLHGFYDKLPVSLQISNPEYLEFCPPPHIFCLNILFHTVIILVYRPFLSLGANHKLYARAREVCLENAKLVNAFFKLYGRTFNYRNQTYLVSYCVYTAATVELHELQHSTGDDSQAAAERLSTTMRMLETEARQTPGIRRSIDIVKSRLKTWGSVALEKEGMSSQAEEATMYTSGMQFPFDSGIEPGRLREGSSTTADDEVLATGHRRVDDRSGLVHGHVSQTHVKPYTPAVFDEYAALGWNLYDSGGGFVPEMTNWTWLDTTILPDSPLWDLPMGSA